MSDTPLAGEVFERIRATLNGANSEPAEHPQTGSDLEPRRKCRTCGEYKVLSEFGSHRQGGPKRHDCRACCSAELRDRRNGVPIAPKVNVRTVAMNERRTEVRRLFEQGLTYQEIADRLGAHISTIQHDVHAMKLPSRVGKDRSSASSSVVDLVDSVTAKWDAFADLIHDGRQAIVDLDDVDISWEMRAEWKRRLSHIGRAMRTIRKHT